MARGSPLETQHRQHLPRGSPLETVHRFTRSRGSLAVPLLKLRPSHASVHRLHFLVSHPSWVFHCFQSCNAINTASTIITVFVGIVFINCRSQCHHHQHHHHVTITTVCSFCSGYLYQRQGTYTLHLCRRPWRSLHAATNRRYAGHAWIVA